MNTCTIEELILLNDIKCTLDGGLLVPRCGDAAERDNSKRSIFGVGSFSRIALKK